MGGGGGGHRLKTFSRGSLLNSVTKRFDICHVNSLNTFFKFDDLAIILLLF